MPLMFQNFTEKPPGVAFIWSQDTNDQLPIFPVMKIPFNVLETQGHGPAVVLKVD